MEKVRGPAPVPTGSPTQGLYGSFKERSDVVLCRRGDRFSGTLYFAEHHLIFSWAQPPEHGSKPRTRQVWITYPMIAHCTYRPMPAATRQRPAIRLRCRDFTFVAFQFNDEAAARDSYDTIKSLTCLAGNLRQLHAFSYQPPPEEARCNGWEVYDARREFRRMGIGPKEADKGWRLSEINHDYAVSEVLMSYLVTLGSDVDHSTRQHIPPCWSSPLQFRTTFSSTAAFIDQKFAFLH